jgi:hypothetical protein
MGDVIAVAKAMDIGDGLELAADLSVMSKAAKRPAVEADVAPRTDLPKNHPLYGSRAVRCVPAGMPDCTIVDGRLVPIVAKEPEPIEPEPKPIDEKPLDDGEVVR